MARARNIKPGFFSNDQLVELSFETRLLFIGLWTIADREGRLLDRPKKIKMDVFPGDNVDCDAALDSLAAAGFIRRYETDGIKAIHIINWDRHQNPHLKEASSIIPAPEDRREKDIAPDEHQTSTVPDWCSTQPKPEPASFFPERAGLIPDSGFRIPSSLIPDSISLDSREGQNLLPAGKPSRPKKQTADPENETALQSACRSTWAAYAAAYAARYGPDPVRNVKINSLVKQVVQRLGAEEAPLVAAFFVSHANAYYVRKSHDLGSLVADAEKLRMEWASGRMVTATYAQQEDRTQSNFNSANEAIRILEGVQA